MITLEAGRTIAGKYRLERPLAKGGMGAVWVARHVQLDVGVAVKFMDPDTAASEEARVRFEREAKASAQLKSPHIVQVHDYGVEDTTPYLVMELLEGEDLSTRLKREGRLSLAATAAFLVQLGKGLRRAHEAGIVHRDLKPGNIFLQRQDGEVFVKILDFGIAKSIVPDKPLVGDATKTGAAIGSPQYMSPEQLRNSKAIDQRTDLWAIGVILFRCLTGELPFQAPDLTNLIFAICMEPIPAPSAVAPDLGPAVDRFFERALARDPSQRFQSVTELVEAFLALPGARSPGAEWADPRASQPLLPDSDASPIAAAASPGTETPGRLKSDTGPSGAVPSPHVIALGAPAESISSSITDGRGPGTSKSGLMKWVIAATAAALLSGAVGLSFLLRSEPSPSAASGVGAPPSGASLPTVNEASSATSPQASTAAPSKESPSVSPAPPAVSASATAATSPSSSAKSPAPGAGRAQPRSTANKEIENPLLGF